MIDSVLILLLGLIVLIVGGDFLVKGAVVVSRKLKISSLVIGMTVVAFGTSAPELLVSMKSAFEGNPGIAIGNVVGSNIANIALVLGLAVIILPISVDSETKKVDYPMMLFATLLTSIFCLDYKISFYEGAFMFGLLIFFITRMILDSRKKEKARLEALEDEFKDLENISSWKISIYLMLGFLGLYFGAEWFVKGSVELAEVLLETNPNRDVIIGVTVVAFGTSAPELVASVMAAIRKESNISVGNIIGSNIFNLFAVLGLTSTVKEMPISEELLEFDLPWMIFISVLLLLMIYFGNKLTRFKGGILFISYLTYIGMILYQL